MCCPHGQTKCYIITGWIAFVFTILGFIIPPSVFSGNFANVLTCFTSVTPGGGGGGGGSSSTGDMPYYTCETCTLAGSYGWCSNVGRCSVGNSVDATYYHCQAGYWYWTSASCPSVDYSPPPPYTGGGDLPQYTTCLDCTSTGGAGWCDYYSRCSLGDNSGPDDYYCPSGYWDWTTSDCGGATYYGCGCDCDGTITAQQVDDCSDCGFDGGVCGSSDGCSAYYASCQSSSGRRLDDKALGDKKMVEEKAQQGMGLLPSALAEKFHKAKTAASVSASNAAKDLTIATSALAHKASTTAASAASAAGLYLPWSFQLPDTTAYVHLASAADYLPSSYKALLNKTGYELASVYKAKAVAQQPSGVRRQLQAPSTQQLEEAAAGVSQTVWMLYGIPGGALLFFMFLGLVLGSSAGIFKNPESTDPNEVNQCLTSASGSLLGISSFFAIVFTICQLILAIVLLVSTAALVVAFQNAVSSAGAAGVNVCGGGGGSIPSTGGGGSSGGAGTCICQCTGDHISQTMPPVDDCSECHFDNGGVCGSSAGCQIKQAVCNAGRRMSEVSDLCGCINDLQALLGGTAAGAFLSFAVGIFCSIAVIGGSSAFCNKSQQLNNSLLGNQGSVQGQNIQVNVNTGDPDPTVGKVVED